MLTCKLPPRVHSLGFRCKKIPASKMWMLSGLDAKRERYREREREEPTQAERGKKNERQRPTFLPRVDVVLQAQEKSKETRAGRKAEPKTAKIAPLDLYKSLYKTPKQSHLKKWRSSCPKNFPKNAPSQKMAHEFRTRAKQKTDKRHKTGKQINKQQPDTKVHRNVQRAIQLFWRRAVVQGEATRRRLGRYSQAWWIDWFIHEPLLGPFIIGLNSRPDPK